MIEANKEVKLTELTEEQLEKQLDIIRAEKEQDRLDKEKAIELEEERLEQIEKVKTLKKERYELIDLILGDYKQITTKIVKSNKNTDLDRVRNALKIELLKTDLDMRLRPDNSWYKIFKIKEFPFTIEDQLKTITFLEIVLFSDKIDTSVQSSFRKTTPRFSKYEEREMNYSGYREGIFNPVKEEED